MGTLDFATLTRRETTLGAIADLLPWESELSDLAREHPDFSDADVVVIDGDLDVGDQDINLDNLYPDDLDRPLPFLVLVRGGVRARSVVNTDVDGGTHLFVLGDLHADFLITLDQETFVGGALRLRRAWWGLGEPGRLIVRDVITAPALIADGYRIDDDRIRHRHGVLTTAFLMSDGTTYLPRAHVQCVLAEEFISDTASDPESPEKVAEWTDIIDVLEAVLAGADPFADPISDPAVDLFIPDLDLVGLSADAVLNRFADEVTPEAVAAVLLDPVVLDMCETYDDDLIDEEYSYSVRAASEGGPARLTILRALSDSEQRYRIHHFEAREIPSGAVYIELLTQDALGVDHDVTPVDRHEVGHYVDALTSFRRLQKFLAEA